ncbi:cofilin-1-like [Notolabrus celidotus]|uniref:cofilin-1-like n=1 Tax=Notolabrus celidotus TaxID=1203425 RepID=UPI001490020E|nr:cofilin-1-like [Notolabrus celidotus]
MASGIAVTDKVKTLVENMKVVKSSDDSARRLRIATFTIQDEQIDVDRTFSECDLDGQDAFQVFKSLLTDKSCFYFLYDCHFETKEGIKKEEMVFGSWVPEDTVVKLRMKYASSRSSIKNIMKGTKHDLQMNDPSDFQNRAAFAELLEKNAPAIKEIEGIAL